MGIWLGPRGRAAYAAEGKGFGETRPPLRAPVISSDHRDMIDLPTTFMAGIQLHHGTADVCPKATMRAKSMLSRASWSKDPHACNWPSAINATMSQ